MKMDNGDLTRPGWPSPQKAKEQHFGNVSFHARCDAKDMFVLVRSHPRRAFVLARMEPAAEGEWQVMLKLPPGGYRYRYYADYGGALVYVSPADVELWPPAMQRLDAAFYVGERLRSARSKLARHCLHGGQTSHTTERLRRSLQRSDREELMCNRDAHPGIGPAIQDNDGRRSAAPRPGDG